MEVTFWGVRGSAAGSTASNTFYGGNTACVEVRTQCGMLIVLDAGSGIRLLGDTLGEAGECHVFISHGHLDHIQGLCFFTPLHKPGWTTHLYYPAWLNKHLYTLFNGINFPVHMADLQGNIVRHLLRAGEKVTLAPGSNPVRVDSFITNHPGGALGYRVQADNACLLYSGDHEISPTEAAWGQTLEMLQGADIAIVDAMFTKQTFKPGWGHSTGEDWGKAAKAAGVPYLVLTHHAPEATDEELDTIQQNMQSFSCKECHVCCAHEGLSVSLPSLSAPVLHDSEWLKSFIAGLAKYRDEHILLDRILAKTREVTRADAGTIFLAEGNELVFAYTHNDTLFTTDMAHKHAYADIRLPLKQESIAGYAALTGKVLNIPNVHTLPAELPYTFNSSFDKRSGYNTTSMLTVPLFARTGKLLGVMQLINKLNARHVPCPFSQENVLAVEKLAHELVGIIALSALVRKNIYRLLAVASVHDPTETGPHAERVGAMAAELYHHWAKEQGENPDAIRHVKSNIRLAAMLHDIGKVGVSDLILKKPGKLDDAEFTTMQTHTSMGALLLRQEDEDITPLAHEIALHHHQKWNGQGYAGNAPQLCGESIPFAARITAIADVFDALVSPRCYKKPWTFAAACELLQKEAGNHFDPLMVKCFLDIQDIVTSVYQRFPDAQANCGNRAAL